MKKIILVLCLVLFGCSYSPNAVQIEIDSSFLQDKRELILQSLSDWSVKTNGGFGISTISYPDGLSGDTEDNCIKFVNQNVTGEKNSKNPNLTVLGFTNTEYSTVAHPADHVQAIIYVWDGEPNATFGPVVRHELGHAFNLGHYCNEQQNASGDFSCAFVSTDPEPAIMYPAISSGITEVQPIDVYRFCQLWSCPQ